MADKNNINDQTLKRWPLGIVLVLIVLFSFSCQDIPSPKKIEGSTDAIYEADNKLWAHAMNSVDTALKRIDEFQGIELDVVFEKENGTFNVRHDVESASSDVYLKKYLEMIDAKNDKIYYWIDFKNLNSDNLKEATNRLKELISERDLANRMVVESFMATEIVELNKSGIRTSFWIPHLGQNSTKEDSSRAFSLIDGVIKSGCFNALSAHYKMLPFLQGSYPDNNIHLWTNGLITGQDKAVISDLHDQNDVKVILVDYPTNFIDL